MGNDALHGFASRDGNAGFDRMMRRNSRNVLLGYLLPTCALIVIDVTGALRFLAPVLLLTPLWGLKFQARVWRHYVAAFGFPPLGDLHRVLALDQFRGYDPRSDTLSGSDRATVGSIAPDYLLFAGVCTVVSLYTGLLTPLFPAVALLSLLLKGLIRRARPPSIFLLDASDGDSTRLQMRLFQTVAPHMVAACLRNESILAGTRQVLNFLSYRTASDADWQHVVTTLMTVTPVVVIDLRNDTENLRFEINFARANVDPSRLFFIVDRPGPQDGFTYLREGELIEYLHRRFRQPLLSQHRRQAPGGLAGVYHDAQNGYFSWQPPAGWAAIRQQDIRTKVRFLHPSHPDVNVSFIVRCLPSETFSSLRTALTEFGEPGQDAERLGFRVRISETARNGVPAFRVYGRGRDGARLVMWRWLTPNHLNMNVQYIAPTLNLFREHWQQVQAAVATIRWSEHFEADDSAERAQEIARCIRVAELAVETTGRRHAEQILRECLREYPGDARLQQTLDDLLQQG